MIHEEVNLNTGITILGSTGTIGVNTLDVIGRNPDRYRVVALTAWRNIEALFEQCSTWEPTYAVMADESAAERLQVKVRRAGLSTEVLGGVEALQMVSSHDAVRYVMAGIVGAAGLLPTLAAAQAGKRVLLANKEALVMSGRLFIEAVREHGAELVPIDSEHNAIFQCLPTGATPGLNGARPLACQSASQSDLGIDTPSGAPAGALAGKMAGVRRILLTGSGGPFRTTALEDMGSITPEQACAHPNWVMGRKISVDSATMMNKGLEVIEACWLFATRTANIEVVIHPQSIIHSMVEYADGSILAQLGHPDMRTPIAHALGWPERIESGVASLDFTLPSSLDFEAPDFSRTPCLRLGFEAADAGGTVPATLNAANEVAVAAFLERKVRFLDIPRIIEATLSDVPRRGAVSLAAVLEADVQARAVAQGFVAAVSH